jgi:hypothetical protein
LASAHKSCHAKRHAEPEWARERVQRTLSLLGELAAAADRTPHQGGIEDSRQGRQDPSGAPGAGKIPSRGDG